jgi:glycine/D-amino acid oxidase-like deaminating enzyme
VETERGFIGAKKIGVSAAGNTSVVMNMAGLEFPLESYPLQALVSEPVKPIFPCVVMSNTVHAYISQSDKGELVIGAGTDQYTRIRSAARSTSSSTRWRRSARSSRSSPACACCAPGAGSWT